MECVLLGAKTTTTKKNGVSSPGLSALKPPSASCGMKISIAQGVWGVSWGIKTHYGAWYAPLVASGLKDHIYNTWGVVSWVFRDLNVDRGAPACQRKELCTSFDGIFLLGHWR